MQLEDFQIGDLVHEDSLGKAYQATFRDGEKPVRIKILNASYSQIPGFIGTFKQSAAHARDLKNDNLLKVLGHGSSDYGDFIVSEATALHPLEQLLTEGTVLPALDATAFIQRLAVTIRAVHIDGLVHGALTPQNIFVNRQFEEVRIAGWGFEPVIRLLIDHKVDHLKYSLPYLSPEITTAGAELQRQSDIYSVGVIFYRLMVGSTPWSEDDTRTFYLNGRRPPVIPPSLQRLEIPDLLDEVILQALDADIENRCPNLSILIKKINEARSDIFASFTPTSAFLYEPEQLNGTSAPPQSHTAAEAPAQESSTHQHQKQNVPAEQRHKHKESPEPPTPTGDQEDGENGPAFENHQERRNAGRLANYQNRQQPERQDESEMTLHAGRDAIITSGFEEVPEVPAEPDSKEKDIIAAGSESAAVDDPRMRESRPPEQEVASEQDEASKREVTLEEEGSPEKQVTSNFTASSSAVEEQAGQTADEDNVEVTQLHSPQPFNVDEHEVDPLSRSAPEEDDKEDDDYKLRLLSHEEDFFTTQGSADADTVIGAEELSEGREYSDEMPEVVSKTQEDGMVLSSHNQSQVAIHDSVAPVDEDDSSITSSFEQADDDELKAEPESILESHNEDEKTAEPPATPAGEAVEPERAISDPVEKPAASSGASEIPRTFETLVANEFDDGLAPSAKTGDFTKPATPAVQPERAAGKRAAGNHQIVQRSIETRNKPAAKAKSPARVQRAAPITETPVDRQVSFEDMEDFDETTATQTEDFTTTHTIDIHRLAGEGRTIGWLLKMILVSILPLTALYFIVAIAFDMEVDFRKNPLFQRFIQKEQTSDGANVQHNLVSREPVLKSPNSQLRRSRRQQNGAARRPGGSPPAGSDRNQAVADEDTAASPVESASENRNVRDNTFQEPAPQARRTLPAENARQSRSLNSPTDINLNLEVGTGIAPGIANVFIDGRLVGVTNNLGRLNIPALQPGQSYLMKVQKSGFKMWAGEVSFATAGQHAFLVELEREPTVSDSQDSSVTTARQLENRPDSSRTNTTQRAGQRRTNDRPRSTAPPASVETAREFGTVDIRLANVESISDVYIYVNGALWNGSNYVAPARIELPAGTYLIEVRKHGYFSAPPSHSVTILNGEVSTITFILTAQ